jgi:hypothetical protein
MILSRAALSAKRCHRPASALALHLFRDHVPTTIVSSAKNRLLRPDKAVVANRRSFSSVVQEQLGGTMSEQRKNVALGVVGGLFLAVLHSATGSQNDFFDYRFPVEKNPEDLATFYGGEEFMELFCIFPFVGQLMMRNGHFDEKGNVITTGIPGTLRVSMVFSDEIDEKSGVVEWFNKRERFRNILFGWTCWDMVINFGFRTLDNGGIEVYHYGEYFHGNLPVVAQIMKLVFTIHARWLAWSTEHHLNHYAFTAETEDEEKFEEESRQNMPLFLLKNYAWTDLMAMMFGREVDKPSFLVRKPVPEESEDSSIVREKQRILPIQREATKFQISQDIATDRLTTKDMLARNPTKTPDDMTALLTRQSTLKREDSQEAGLQIQSIQSNAYGAATKAASLRRLSRAVTRRTEQVNQEESV